uniref:Uncharacterized protein n=1 Tax=uncultured marine virus TaxID=186617 RepID=A0A0F7L7B5_9VIRU|nr:hypothetical protein [uncultured marine virus]
MTGSPPNGSVIRHSTRMNICPTCSPGDGGRDWYTPSEITTRAREVISSRRCGLATAATRTPHSAVFRGSSPGPTEAAATRSMNQAPRRFLTKTATTTCRPPAAVPWHGMKGFP